MIPCNKQKNKYKIIVRERKKLKFWNKINLDKISDRKKKKRNEGL